ncbi:MAG: cyanophycin synthetase, partial [Anaerovorax sp.]
YLGDTLEKIAVEKAGIIKEGVPVISNVKDGGAAEAIEKIAREKNCPYYGFPLGYANHLVKTVDSYGFDLKLEEKVAGSVRYDNLYLSMIGMHQVENAICAISVIKVLQKKGIISVSTDEIYTGMKKAVQTGRMEVISHKPMVIIDGAHNEAGAGVLKDAIKFHFPDKKIFMVVGMLSDKKIKKILEPFYGITDEFIATEPDNPRKLSAHILCEEIKNNGKGCVAFPDPREAFEYVGRRMDPQDVVVVAGSLYLIGKIRGMVKNEKK